MEGRQGSTPSKKTQLEKIRAYLRLNEGPYHLLVNPTADGVVLSIESHAKSTLLDDVVSVIQTLPHPHLIDIISIKRGTLTQSLDLEPYHDINVLLDSISFTTQPVINLSSTDLASLFFSNCSIPELKVPASATIKDLRFFNCKVGQLQLEDIKQLRELRSLWSEIPNFSIPKHVQALSLSCPSQTAIRLDLPRLKFLELYGEVELGSQAVLDKLEVVTPQLENAEFRDFYVNYLSTRWPETATSNFLRVDYLEYIHETI